MNPSLPRVVFMGTPELARTVLHQLALDRRFQVVGVVAQPDRPSGRNLNLLPPPVKIEANALGLPLWQPERARDAGFLEILTSLNPDVIVVAAYGQILPPSILALPRYGCLNLHTSLLPRWRGAAPIQWAIAEGDADTGVTLMQMEAGLDTGPMLATLRTPIHPDETSETLHDRLAEMAAELLLTHLSEHLERRLIPVPQPPQGVTYARKITREDGRVDWSKEAQVLDRRRRAFLPWPGAFCFLPVEPLPRLIKIHAASVEPTGADETSAVPPGTVLEAGPGGIVVACGIGRWRIIELQPEGGKRLTAAQFLAGHRIDFLT